MNNLDIFGIGMCMGGIIGTLTGLIIGRLSTRNKMRGETDV